MSKLLPRPNCKSEDPASCSKSGRAGIGGGSRCPSRKSEHLDQAMSLRVQGHLLLRWNHGEKEIGMKTKSSEMARMQTALAILFLAIRLASAGQTADAAVAEANPLGRGP